MRLTSGQGRPVKPLLFVNWRRVHAMFCGSMWIIAVILAVVVIIHTALPAESAHQAARIMK
jgi:hypothetical protein